MKNQKHASAAQTVQSTPRTDAYTAYGDDYPQQKVVPASFAGELERTNGELLAALKAVEPWLLGTMPADLQRKLFSAIARAEGQT